MALITGFTETVPRDSQCRSLIGDRLFAAVHVSQVHGALPKLSSRNPRSFSVSDRNLRQSSLRAPNLAHTASLFLLFDRMCPFKSCVVTDAAVAHSKFPNLHWSRVTSVTQTPQSATPCPRPRIRNMYETMYFRRACQWASITRCVFLIIARSPQVSKV